MQPCPTALENHALEQLAILEQDVARAGVLVREPATTLVGKVLIKRVVIRTQSVHLGTFAEQFQLLGLTPTQFLAKMVKQ